MMPACLRGVQPVRAHLHPRLDVGTGRGNNNHQPPIESLTAAQLFRVGNGEHQRGRACRATAGLPWMSATLPISRYIGIPMADVAGEHIKPAAAGSGVFGSLGHAKFELDVNSRFTA
eukprot:SAG31_NODE_8935_length_1361_cov_0.966719_1_plen_117_part_00